MLNGRAQRAENGEEAWFQKHIFLIFLSIRQFELRRVFQIQKRTCKCSLLFQSLKLINHSSHDSIMSGESDSPSRIIEIIDKVVLIDNGVLVTCASGDHPNKIPVLSWLLTVLTVRTEPFKDLEELGLLPNSQVPSSRFFLEIISDQVKGRHSLMEFERSGTKVEASLMSGIIFIVGEGFGVVL